MSMQDPIADMLTRIRNAGNAGLSDLEMPASNIKAAIASVLKQEGYIADFKVSGDKAAERKLAISLKYCDGKPVIEGIKRVSRPSRRVYVSSAEIPRVLGGLGVAILTTSQGLVTDRTARKRGVGGELLCYVW